MIVIANFVNLYRMIIWAAAAAAAALAYAAYPEQLNTLYELLARGDTQAGIDFLRSFGPNAMIVSFLLIVAINTLGVLPNIFILAANGAIFGVALGTLLSWVAESTGAILGFWLFRRFRREFAAALENQTGAMQEIQRLNGAQGFKLLLISRMAPYMPTGLVTALAAISSTSFRDHALATVAGKLPSVWLEVMVGHDLLAHEEHFVRLLFVAAVSVGLFCWVWQYKRKYTKSQ